MKVTALAAHGIDNDVLDVWQSSGHEELLPIQEEAVREGKVLEGKNVVIFSPTSSGKTFVGEMACVKMARQFKRSIYLVPQKALAEEKYQEFKRLYSSLGIRVVVSTRDHREHDTDIRRGHFHIAVVVFEKMQGLLVVSPHVLSQVGCVVIDELQMIGDRTRGAALEILLTKIKESKAKAQIIGLSAVLGSSQRIAQWLNAYLCKTSKRPVELRKGILHAGKFEYLEHNSGETGTEEFGIVEDADDQLRMLINQAGRFAAAGESCLIFCKTKQECIKLAALIGRANNLPPARKALAEVNHLEESDGKDVLLKLLDNSVAYHNADLDWDQRDIVERYFRKGEIRLVCATSTLAMGLNLPAKNVFIDPQRWDQDEYGNWGLAPITSAEYENMSGRAGRYGLEKDFGRAIIVTDSRFDARTFFEQYVKGQIADVVPALAHDTLPQHALNLVASHICKTPLETRETLLASYTGQQLWSGGDREKEFTAQLDESLQHCIEGGLLVLRDKQLSATTLGRIAAVKGLATDTAIQMAVFARMNLDRAAQVTPLEVILCLSKTHDGERIHFNLSTEEYNSNKYLELLKAVITKQPLSTRQQLALVLRMRSMEYERAKRAKKALIMHEWTMGMPTRQIERCFNCFAGSVLGLATEFSWLAEAFALVTKYCNWPAEESTRMLVLSEQMLYGVPKEGLEIAKARVRGLARGRAMLMVEHKLDMLEKIAEAPMEKLAKLLTKPVAERLIKRVGLILAYRAARKEEQADGMASAKNAGVPPPDLKEWAEEYLPVDDVGDTYLPGVRLQIDGRCSKRRYLVLVNKHECLLSEGSFAALLKLCVAAKTNPLGWVPCNQLGSMDTYHQVACRLNQDLQFEQDGTAKLVMSNWRKEYRLSIPPRHIALNRKKVLQHYPEAQDILAELDRVSKGTLKQVAG